MNDRDPALRLVHLLRAIMMELDIFGAEFADDNGLHPTDVRALINLLDAGRAGIEATPGWLGRELGLNSASTTALVDRLERLRLVRRERDTIDRRRVLLTVEDRAIDMGWAYFKPLVDEMLDAMGAFDDAELATVRRFLLSMRDVVTAGREARRGDAR